MAETEVRGLVRTEGGRVVGLAVEVLTAYMVAVAAGVERAVPPAAVAPLAGCSPVPCHR